MLRQQQLALPTRTNAAHVPDTGYHHEAFPSNIPAFFSRAHDVVVVFTLCNLNYQQANPQIQGIFNATYYNLQ